MGFNKRLGIKISKSKKSAVFFFGLIAFMGLSIATAPTPDNPDVTLIVEPAELMSAEAMMFRRACTDLPTLSFNFFDSDDGDTNDNDEATLEAGDGTSVGTIYRYYDVTGDGTTDAEVEIINIKDARIVNFDQSTSGTQGNFQPQIAPNVTGVDVYIDFEFRFYQAGSTIFQNFIDYAASAVDVDGNNVDAREFVGFQSLESFTVEATNSITNGFSDIFYTFESTTTQVVNGIDPSATTNVVYSTYDQVSTFRIRSGVKDAGGTTGAGYERLFSFNFDPCIINNFNNANTTNVFDLEIRKTVDDGNPDVGDTVSFKIIVENLDDNTDATGVIVRDSLPDGLTYESHTVTQGTYEPNSGVNQYNWNLGLVPFSVSDTLVLNAIVDTGTEGDNIRNDASIPSFNGADRNVSNNSTSASLVVRTPVGPACQEPPFFSFNDSATLEQGTSLSVGALYRFSSVASGVDALLTIEAASNASVTAINNSASTQFEPTINTTAAGGYIDFSIRFVQSGTGVSKNYAEIPVSGLDIDGLGTGSLRDFVGFANFQSFTIEQFGSEISQSSTGDYTTFTAINNTNETGNIQSTTDNIAYIIFKNTPTVFLRAGTNGDGASRDVYFDFTDCIIDNYDSPETTDVSTDIAITKTVDDNNPTERDTVQFVLTIDNNGPLAATGVVVRDSLPDGLTLINGIVSKGTFNPTTGEWDVGTILSSGQETLTLNYYVDPQAADITLTNVAFINELNQNDTNTANDTSSVDVDVVTNPDADIEVLKSITSSTNSTIQFQVKAINKGPTNATNVVVKDSLTTTLTFDNASGDGIFTGGTGIWDIGNIAAGDTSTITLNYSTGSIVSGTNYSFLQSLEQDDTVIDNDTASVPFTFNAFISGTVFEDITGDALTDGDTNLNDGSGDQRPLSGVEVHLYQDLGNNGLSTSEDYVSTTTTDANGNYLFEITADSTYWVVVDSRTGDMTNGTTWPDQTYGPAGALCADGSGGTSAASGLAGPCYGGKRGAVSDSIPDTPLNTSIDFAEHLAEVVVASANSVSEVDFGFSFNVVTNLDDADDSNGDGSSRWHQGTLRQFVNNANQIDGDNVMRFVPAVSTNQTGGGGNWWRMTTNTTSMPTLIDGGTTLDGTAYDFQDPDQVRNLNSGTVGGDGGTITTVGVDAVAFDYFEKKELEINTAETPLFIVNSSEGSVKVREMAFYNGNESGVIQIQQNPGGVVEENFIGPFADGTTPVGNDRVRSGVYFTDSNISFSIEILNNYMGFSRYDLIESINEDVFITVRGNEIFESGLQPSANADGISGTGIWTIEENIIRDHGTTTSSAIDGGAGIEIGRDGDTSPASGTITNNTIFDNQSTGIAVIEDIDGLTISKNIIQGNGVQFAADPNPKNGAGIKLLNSDGEREIKGVTISQNQIFDNEGLGIDLSSSSTNADGVTGNDGTIDSDYTSSPNGLIDYPIVTSVSTDGTDLNIEGYVGIEASKINETFTIEVFVANDDGDNAGEIENGDGAAVAHGEGRYYVGSTVTNTSGEFGSRITIPGALTLNSGDYITVTATDSDGNTSEFSANYQVADLDIAITKILINNSPIPVDEKVTFLIIAENKGPTAATGVTVEDILTSELTLDAANTSATTGSFSSNTWTIGSMADGQIDTLTLVADPNSTGLGLTNTAYLETVNESDFNSSNDTSSVGLDINTIIRGVVFEDITGDGLSDGDTNFEDSSGDQVALSGVVVHLYRDLNGSGLGSSENYVSSTTTDAKGVYSFAPPANDDYWVIVASRSTGLSDGNTWAEQTYGSVGAICADGASGSNAAKVSEGPCFGGRRANTSDLVPVSSPLDTDIANAEHISAVTFSGTSVTDIDFGFSYNVVTNVLDDADDDGTANRWIQGSLRQFFQNANQISGANAMRFTPAVAANDVTGNGWAITSIASSFPALTDGNTTVDGTAYDFQDPDQVLDTNTGTTGTGGTVGVDLLSLPTYENKELEINASDLLFITINSSSGSIIVQDIAIYNAASGGAIQVSNNPGGNINDNFIGARSNGTNPAGASRSAAGIIFEGVNTFTSAINRNYVAFHQGSAIDSENENSIINITENEIYQNGLVTDTTDGIAGLAEWYIEQNLIHENGFSGSNSAEGGAGIEIGKDNELDEGTGTVINNTILDNANSGVNLFDYALNVTIEKNIITENGTTGTATGAGIKMINPDNERNIGGILITQNSFYNNEGLAIDIVTGSGTSANGVTPNDGVVSTDYSNNPNGAIDYPVIDSLTITGTELTIGGYVGIDGGAISDVFSIEFYTVNDDLDNNGEIESGDSQSVAHGEGETYIATIFTATDGTFLETVTIPGTIPLSVGDLITAIAMDGEDNTSEFSANYAITSSGGTISGYVYSDVNHNGQRETDEDGLSGVTIVLRNNTSGTCESVQTNADGLYQFKSVEPDTYTIVEAASETTPTPAACPATEADLTGYVSTTENTINITVSGGIIQDQNFGDFLGFRIDGRVYQDDGLTGGTANNATQDGEEAGLDEVTVIITDNSDVAIQMTATDENGDYSFWISETETTNGATLKIKQSNLTSYLSTGGEVGTTGGTFDRTTDVITFTNSFGTTFTGANFADVPQNRLLTDNEQYAQPGTSVFFTHQFDAKTDGTVTFSLTNNPTPSNVTWPVLLYFDDNCNGEIDSGTDTIISDPRVMTSGENICLIVRTSVPIGVPDGGENSIILQADFSFTNASPALDQTYKRNDKVTVGEDISATLKITKTVDQTQALPGATLTYTITYTNNGDDPLSTIEVKDSTPAYTTFTSATFSTPLPNNLTGCTINAPSVGETGGVTWVFTGSLDPGQSGTVSYTVTIDN